jgi:hypothetical protein
MTKYEIEVTEEARTDLNYYNAFERKIITSGIRVQLTNEPMLETKKPEAIARQPNFLLGAEDRQVSGFLRS